jgi:adhesin transport system membrane fusion protein
MAEAREKSRVRRAIRRWLRPPSTVGSDAWLDRVFARPANATLADSIDWAADAHAARLARDPLRARALLHVVAAVVFVLIVWAAFARIDEVTRGEAKVVPSRQLQVIQSLDGGIVSEIVVREGQIVEAGDLLVRIDATRFVSTLRENRAQRLSLLAKTARLAAITENTPFELPEEVRKEAPEIAANEQRLYETSLAELNGQVGIAREQLAQREQELAEARAYFLQASRNFDFASQELAQTEPLVSSGAVSEVEILRLKRDVSRLHGERDQASAQVTRAKAAIEEATRKIEQVELDFRNVKRNELADATSTLNSLSEGSVGLSDRVKQAEVRAPVRGTVKRLLVNTEGGVVLPGRDIVEIVPLDDTLLLEARIAPRDIAFLRPGQSALVKFSAYDFIVYGGLEATVESIGADTITDDKGNPFYLVRVRTHEPTLGQNLPIIPGMVAEVDVMTGRKSVLSYLLKPVLRAKQYALTER